MSERPEIVTDGENFSFEYGVVNISHRLNINKPICHDEITIDRVVSIMLVSKTSGWEFQILYRDENFVVQCGIYQLDDYVVKIKKRGDMGIVL